MESVIIKNADIGYNKNNILFNDFNFSVNQSEFVSILGKTGIGKTTILKSIIGLVNLISGKIEVNGTMSFSFQDNRLFPHMDVYNNIKYPLSINKCKSDKLDKIDEMLKLMDIEYIKNSNVEELSAGEAKRVSLARALITEPDILLLDEPTANLDFEVKLKIRELINNIHKNNNKTVIMVTHDTFDALSLSDKILILDEKKVITYVDRKNIHNDEKALKYFEPFMNEIKNIKL